MLYPLWLVLLQARGVCEVIGIYSLLAEVSHDEAKMRGRREYPSFLSFLSRRERPLLAGKAIGSESVAKQRRRICVLFKLLASIWLRSICQMQAISLGVEF